MYTIVKFGFYHGSRRIKSLALRRRNKKANKKFKFEKNALNVHEKPTKKTSFGPISTSSKPTPTKKLAQKIMPWKRRIFLCLCVFFSFSAFFSTRADTHVCKGYFNTLMYSTTSFYGVTNTRTFFSRQTKTIWWMYRKTLRKT
jgi:hypothetical protein